MDFAKASQNFIWKVSILRQLSIICEWDLRLLPDFPCKRTFDIWDRKVELLMALSRVSIFGSCHTRMEQLDKRGLSEMVQYIIEKLPIFCLHLGTPSSRALRDKGLGSWCIESFLLLAQKLAAQLFTSMTTLLLLAGSKVVDIRLLNATEVGTYSLIF